MKMDKICVPGERLVPLSDSVVPGYGTYVKHGYIYCSIAGRFTRVPEQMDAQDTAASSTNTIREVVSIVRKGTHERMVPDMNSIVTAKVTQIYPRYCKCSIYCVNDHVLHNPFNAQIRKEDVRKTEKDKVDMLKCFRPGDIIVAKVCNLGDSHVSYNLSTADDTLGVFSAKCDEGHEMRPIDFEWMECTVTGHREPRKIAKVPHITQ